MRNTSFGLGLVLLLAATTSQSIASDYETKGNGAPVSVCELLKDGGPSKATRIRVKAHYITDLRHGAYLDDPRCKGLVIEEGDQMADPVDPGVARFHDSTQERMFSHPLVQFDMDVEGTYTPRLAGEFWGNEAKGRLVFERVYSFRRTSSAP